MGAGQSTMGSVSIISGISSSSLCCLLMILIFVGFIFKTSSNTLAQNPQLLELAAL